MFLELIQTEGVPYRFLNSIISVFWEIKDVLLNLSTCKNGALFMLITKSVQG